MVPLEMRQRGSEPMGVLMVLGFVAVMGCLLILSAHRGAADMANGPDAFRELLQEAKTVAATSSYNGGANSGATIEVTPAAQGVGFVAILRPLRPMSSGGYGTISAVHQVSAAVPLIYAGSTSFGLFISSSGTVSAQSGWTNGNTMTSEPACPGSGYITLQFGTAGASVRSFNIPCTDAVMP